MSDKDKTTLIAEPRSVAPVVDCAKCVALTREINRMRTQRDHAQDEVRRLKNRLEQA